MPLRENDLDRHAERRPFWRATLPSASSIAPAGLELATRPKIPWVPGNRGASPRTGKTTRVRCHCLQGRNGPERGLRRGRRDAASEKTWFSGMAY